MHNHIVSSDVSLVSTATTAITAILSEISFAAHFFPQSAATKATSSSSFTALLAVSI